MSNYQYKVNGVDYQVEIEEREGNIAKVTVNGKPFEVELAKPVKVKPQPKRVQVQAPQPPPQLNQRRDPPSSPRPLLEQATRCLPRCQAPSRM